MYAGWLSWRLESYRTEVGVSNVRVDPAGIAVIERVEGLETELQAGVFGEFEVLDERHIPDLNAGTQDCAGTGTGEVTHRRRKGRGVEEFSSCFRSIRVADLVGPNEYSLTPAASCQVLLDKQDN